MRLRRKCYKSFLVKLEKQSAPVKVRGAGRGNKKAPLAIRAHGAPEAFAPPGISVLRLHSCRAVSPNTVLICSKIGKTVQIKKPTQFGKYPPHPSTQETTGQMYSSCLTLRLKSLRHNKSGVRGVGGISYFFEKKEREYSKSPTPLPLHPNPEISEPLLLQSYRKTLRLTCERSEPN